MDCEQGFHGLRTSTGGSWPAWRSWGKATGEASPGTSSRHAPRRRWPATPRSTSSGRPTPARRSAGPASSTSASPQATAMTIRYSDPVQFAPSYSKHPSDRAANICTPLNLLWFQLPSPHSVGTKLAPAEKILHTDRGDVPVNSTEFLFHFVPC